MLWHRFLTEQKACRCATRTTSSFISPHSFMPHLPSAQFPIGIDAERFISALETNVVKTHVAELRARFHGRKVRSEPGSTGGR